MSKTPNQTKRIRALSRAYRNGVEETIYQVADWLGLVESEEDEPTAEDVKAEIMRLVGEPIAARHLAADILCEIRDADPDGEALFEHALDVDDWTLAEAGEEGYTADEIASLNLDGAPEGSPAPTPTPTEEPRRAPCQHCGKDTDEICTDCAIDKRPQRHVCRACRGRHICRPGLEY